MSEELARDDRGWLRRLYDWTLSLSASPRAPQALAAVSFAESSFFPIPPDAVLVPMCIARPERAWFYAAVCTVASVLGGLLGYAIGALLFESVGQWIISLYGYGERMEAFRQGFAEWGLWIILIKGLTPIPYKIVTIACGFAGFDLVVFVLASLVTRAARFFLVAALIRQFGAPIKDFIEKRLNAVAFGLLAVIVGGFVLVRYIF